LIAHREESESARHWFRGIVQSIVEDKESFRLPDVAREALKLAGKDKARYRQFAEEIVYQAAYGMVQGIIGETRKPRGLHVIGEAAFTEEGAVKAFAPKFLRWAIHAGDKTLALGKATSEELRASADEYEGSGKQLLIRARFLRQIDKGLEGGQIVEERYSEEELGTLWEQAEEEQGATT